MLSLKEKFRYARDEQFEDLYYITTVFFAGSFAFSDS